MLKELFVRRPKFSAKEIAETIFAKLFKREIRLAFARIRRDLTSCNQIVDKDRVTIILISLYIFIVDHATSAVYGNTRVKSKILNAFYSLIKQEYKGHDDIIIELSKKFALVHDKKPDDPLFGLGVFFSRCINVKNQPDLLTAMTAATETAKKYKLLTGYYHQLNQEYKIY